MKVSSVLFLIACMLGISAEDAVLSQEVFTVDRQMAVEKHTENLKKQLYEVNLETNERLDLVNLDVSELNDKK